MKQQRKVAYAVHCFRKRSIILSNYGELLFSRQLPFIQKPFLRQLKEGFNSFKCLLFHKPVFWVLFFTLFTRLFFILFTDWGLDFSFYLENVKEIVAGKRLFLEVKTTHMPLADFLYVAMYILNPWKENHLAIRLFMKLPFLLCDIGIALAVMKIVENALQKENEEKPYLDVDVSMRVKKGKVAAGFFVAFGLPLILQTGGGRYDSLLIFCLTMAVLSIQEVNWFGVAFFAAIGTSVKYIGIIFLPFVMIWLKKKKDFILFFSGLFLGFSPLYPFLLTIPREFFEAIFFRGSHIAYGLSIWHALFILWNGFMLKHVGSIPDTYASSDEPLIIRSFYLPFFVIVYVFAFFLYLYYTRQKIRSNTLEHMPLFFQVNLVFLPLFIFVATFKAVNVQVLAWFVPYCALKDKRKLLIEFSLLTILFGFGLLLFEATQSTNFFDLARAAVQGSQLGYTLIVKPIFYLIAVLPVRFFVGIVFITIIWFETRVFLEINLILQELLQQKINSNIAQLLTVATSK